MNKITNKPLGAPVIGLAFLITSFFYALPLGRYKLAGISSDFRMYDIMSIVYFILFGLRSLPYLSTLFKKKELFFRWSIILVFIAFFSLVITLTTSGMTDFLAGLLRLFRFLSFFMVAGYILIFVNSPRAQKFLLMVFYLNIIIQMVLSFAQKFGYLSNFWPEYWLVGYGDFPVGTLSPHHKQIGVVMLLGVAVTIAYFQLNRAMLSRFILLILMGGMVSVSVFVVSRTMWLGLIGLFGAMIFVHGRKGFLLVSLFLFGLSILFLLSPETLQYNLQSDFDLVITSRIERFGAIDLVEDRLRVYDNIPDAVSNYPWILLIGTGFQNISYALRATGGHNNFLQAFFELGIIGLVVYLVFLFKVLGNLRKAQKTSQDEFQSVLAGNVLVGFFGIIATMMVGETLWAQYSMFSLTGQIMVLVALGCVPLQWEEPIPEMGNNAAIRDT